MSVDLQNGCVYYRTVYRTGCLPAPNEKLRTLFFTSYSMKINKLNENAGSSGCLHILSEIFGTEKKFTLTLRSVVLKTLRCTVSRNTLTFTRAKDSIFFYFHVSFDDNTFKAECVF